MSTPKDPRKSARLFWITRDLVTEGNNVVDKYSVHLDGVQPNIDAYNHGTEVIFVCEVLYDTENTVQPPAQREKAIEDRIEKFLSDAAVDVTPIGTAKIGMRILAEWAFAVADAEKNELEANLKTAHDMRIKAQTQLASRDKTISELVKALDQWRDLSEAPEGTVICGRNKDGDEFPMIWSDARVCMLGPRAGECGEGWATPCGYDVDPNLPLNDVIQWRPIEVQQALQKAKAK